MTPSRFLLVIWAACVPVGLAQVAGAALTIAPAPAGEEMSTDFTVTVEGKPLPLYVARVAPADPARRWKAMDDKARSADYFDKASFGYFDLDGRATVTITCPQAIASAKILPLVQFRGKQGPARPRIGRVGGTSARQSRLTLIR